MIDVHKRQQYLKDRCYLYEKKNAKFSSVIFSPWHGHLVAIITPFPLAVEIHLRVKLNIWWFTMICLTSKANTSDVISIYSAFYNLSSYNIYTSHIKFTCIIYFLIGVIYISFMTLSASSVCLKIKVSFSPRWISPMKWNTPGAFYTTPH